MKYFYMLTLMFSLTVKALCMYNTLDFDQLREFDGFSSADLHNVISIIPSEQPFSPEEVLALANSTSLKNLRTLILRDQENVNDQFVKIFSNNPTFSRMITLNLSGTNVTRESFHYILESEYLGKIRDCPLVSGKFGIPYSMIYVRVEDIENLSQKEMREFNRGDKKKDNFTIQYIHPFKNIESPPFAEENREPYLSVKGIKLLEIKDY